MSSVVLILAEVNVSILIDLKASPLTHIVHPLAFVDAAYLFRSDNVFIEGFRQIESHSDALLVVKRAV